MNRGQDGGGSFDPRTWGLDAPDSAPATAPTSDATSFDPRAWALPESGSPPPPAATPPAPRSPLIAPLGSSLAILMAGTIAAWAMHEPPPAAAPAPVEAAAAEAPPAANASRRTLMVAGPDAIVGTLTEAGIPPADAQALATMALERIGNDAGEIRLVIDLVESEGTAQVTRLEASRADGSGLVLTAGPDGYAEQVMKAELKTTIASARGEMDATSFYSSAVAAGIPDSLIGEIAKAFAFDFDFQQEIAPGDVFEAAWEQQINPAGDPVGPPSLIYAQMVTGTKSKALYRFLAPGDAEAGWYDGNGSSTVRSLMRTPVDGARISSKFGFRTHPILNYQKLHRGTDFAAPIGTPMYAAGDAVVEVAAPRGAAGNFVILRHDNGWQTRYMHLNRFADGLVPGARWKQGQQIGEVGTTGRSTGPHLHYEVWIDGEPVDPQSIDTGTGKQLDGDAMKAFRAERDRIDLSRSQRAA